MLAACVGSLALAASARAASPTSYWGQVQSHLEALDGAPLVAANWHGRYRPYVLVGEAFVPLLQGDSSAVPDVDLMSPLPVSATEVLLLGAASGRPEYDLFLYDRTRGALTNLTATPAVDEGNPCVSGASRLLAYRTSGGERVARLRDGLAPLGHGALPAFDRCLWADATTLLGIERRGRAYRLHRCVVANDTVRCEPRAALDDVDTVTAVFPATPFVGVIARRHGDQFRRPWTLAPPFATLAPAGLDASPTGDILELDGRATRVGFHGRYASPLVPGSSATVYATRRIGDATFGIVATDRMTRTLARAESGTWKSFRDPTVAMPADVAATKEIWMRSPTGETYQGFYFGPSAPRRVVVWWHGGPAESISPRFNPYFHRLNELGFGVLAVNYPGSTGRGAVYEARFRPAELADCVRAVWDYLRENDVRAVVSWSVSSGITLQTAVLDARVPVSALIDQSAWGRSTIRQDAAGRGIAVFTIRGRHDPYGPTDHVDFWYPGGHDVTMAVDFVALFDGVAPFLAAVRSVSWDDEDAGTALLLDASAAPADESVAFELATHLRRTCLADRAVAVTPTGVPALAPPDHVRAHGARWLDRHAGAGGVRIVVRAGTETKEGPAAPERHEVRPIDLADAAEVDRVRAHSVTADGSIVHPRLQSAAEAQCSVLRAKIAEPHPRGSAPSPDAPRR
jgi:hypothetical protein